MMDNYTNGTVTSNSNRTATYTYNANGQVLTQTAVFPSSTDNQVTTYTYGTGSSPVASNGRLTTVTYPDPGGSVAHAVSMTYYADGSLKAKTDQRGIELTHSYDNAGRRTSQRVTAGTVGGDQKVAYTYTDLGQPLSVTSYSDSAGTTVTSDVQYAYDGLGNLVTEYQQHGAAVNTSTSPKVQYAYDTTNASNVFTKGYRLKSMTYPSGRILRYEYASGVDDAASRVSSLAEDNAGAVGQTLVSYARLGDGAFVSTDFAQPQTKLTYAGATSGTYSGWDRFNRVVDHTWKNYNTSTTLDSFSHGYDRNSNRLYKLNNVSSANSELYHANGSSNGYDGLDRLTDFSRGTLNGTYDTISTSTRSQSWGLDVLGNMATVTTGGTSVTRTHNKFNEITGVSSGTAPSYDANGNTTNDGTLSFTYDAWNRPLTASGSVNYAYDGLGRRVAETRGGTTTHLYYGKGWRVVEERQGTALTAQYVWGLRYVDELVLRDYDADASSSTGTLGNNGSGTTGLEQRVYALQDANYNVTALTNTSGSVLERFAYDPYGSPTTLTASTWASTSDSYSWAYLHQGGRYDATAGVYHFRNRDLHPGLMRWLQQDPLGYVDGMSLYCYVKSSPILYMDPLGLGTYSEGEPTRPTITWDDGFRYDPNASSTWADTRAWYRYGILLRGAEALGHIPDATRAYAHYREATGTDLNVDYNKAYNEDARIKQGVDAEIGSAQREAERLRKQLGKDTFKMTGTARLVNSGTENWQKALGGHDIWGSGEVTYDCKTETYTMKLKITMEDFYNFNKGQADIATGLPDDENGRFEVFGWAKSFFSRGSLERTVTWKEGQAPEDVDDTGGRGDRDRDRRSRDRDRDRRDRGRGSGRYGM